MRSECSVDRKERERGKRKREKKERERKKKERGKGKREEKERTFNREMSERHSDVELKIIPFQAR